MSDRTCVEWNDGFCVLSAAERDMVSALCRRFVRCMYAAPRESFTPAERELLDAWSHRRVCLWPRPPEWEEQ